MPNDWLRSHRIVRDLLDYKRTDDGSRARNPKTPACAEQSYRSRGCGMMGTDSLWQVGAPLVTRGGGTMTVYEAISMMILFGTFVVLLMNTKK